MFKHLGHTQFLEICTTSKEIMLFHDNGFVLLRLACGFKLSVSRCYGWLESVNFPVNHNIAIRAVYTHFHCFSSLARLVMNFGRHLATSYLSWNIDNKGKTFNSSYNTDYCYPYTFALMSKRLFYFLWSRSSNNCILFSFPEWCSSTTSCSQLPGKVAETTEYLRRWKIVYLKTLSSCLPAVTCFVVHAIHSSVYIFLGQKLGWKRTNFLWIMQMLQDSGLTLQSRWTVFNCLICYWKDKIISTKGMKIIKGLKICRRTKSPIL